MTIRGRRVPAVVALVVAIGVAAWSASAARAEFGPVQLVSISAAEQAAEAVEPAISADGRYVAFAGQLGGIEGVFRKDLQSGAIAVVAQLATKSPGQVAKAANPSISADGRYVAFDTTTQLDPIDDQGKTSPDVYVADMSTSPPTYELASALDDCTPGNAENPCGLTYVTGAEKRSGSVAARGVAISADGRRVAFLVRAESNLAGEHTSGGQVAVRDLDSDRTYLMTTVTGSEAAVPGGGADPESEGAAISGDGSTVAWVGRHLPDQVPMLGDESEVVRQMESTEPPIPEDGEYHEPLWRKLPTALEPDPVTRRMVGGGDPLAPGCPPTGTLADVSCQGPFPETLDGRENQPQLHEIEGLGWGLKIPRLSADGEEVALIGDPGEDDDLFLVDMAPGLSRRDAVRQVTQWVNPAAFISEGLFEESTAFPLVGPVEDCAISPDGNRIAFTTDRQIFPLASPTLVTPVPADASGVREIYQWDRRGETIERLAPGGGTGGSQGAGTDGNGGAASPSYSDEGRFLAFASTATNLVAGDTNSASDAFVVESPPAAPVNPSTISHRPATLVVQPLWRMTVDTSSLPDGRVRITVGLPGSGTLRAKATARVGSRLHRQRVAKRVAEAPSGGLRKMVLALPRKLRPLARRKGGLYAQLDIGFVGAGGKPLHAALDARFVVHRKNVKRKRGHG